MSSAPPGCGWGIKAAWLLVAASRRWLDRQPLPGLDRGWFGKVGAAYRATKGAVRTLTEGAALHPATAGVRVNSLHPGFIGTAQLLEEEVLRGHRGMRR